MCSAWINPSINGCWRKQRSNGKRSVALYASSTVDVSTKVGGANLTMLLFVRMKNDDACKHSEGLTYTNENWYVPASAVRGLGAPASSLSFVAATMTGRRGRRGQ